MRKDIVDALILALSMGGGFWTLYKLGMLKLPNRFKNDPVLWVILVVTAAFWFRLLLGYFDIL